MTIGERLIAELSQEAVVTRRLLKRVPEERFTWKPHERSMSLGQLAMHIAALPRGIAELLTALETELPVVPVTEPASRQEILEALEESLALATERIWEWGDRGLHATWKMTRQGEVLMEMPRLAMVRSVMLNHWYHHRGQLTVYLRMLNVPLPPVYGPTADEDIFGGRAEGEDAG